jgi:hypothetical protein
MAILWLFVGAALVGCAESFDHNSEIASARAEEFARVAFIDRDTDKSYELLAAGTQRYVSREKLKEVTGRLHPRGYPKSVKAGESEPMPGEKALYVFLTGQNGDERFYYRFTMEGTAGTGYRVLQFDRLKAPRGN